MAYYWIDPISHDQLGYYIDIVKLRRPMEIKAIKVSKPLHPIRKLEILGRDLTYPSDTLTTISKQDLVEVSDSYVQLYLDKQVLTNYLKIKGEYQYVVLCLEIEEATISAPQKYIRPKNSEIELLSRCPLEKPGLFQYSVEEDKDGTFLISTRCGTEAFTGGKRQFHPVWKKGNQKEIDLDDNKSSSSDIQPLLELLLSNVCSGVKMSAVAALDTHLSSRRFYEKEVHLNSLRTAKTAKQPKKDDPKNKPQSRGSQKPYQILLQLTMQKHTPKLAHALKQLVNKAAFFISVCNLINTTPPESLGQSLQTFRKNFKLFLNQASSKSYQSIKHDLLSTLVLSKGEPLSSAILLTSHPTLDQTLVEWFDTEGLLTFFLKLLSNYTDHFNYLVIFSITIDFLLTVIKAKGGTFWLIDSGLIRKFAKILSKVSVEGECPETYDGHLLDEENVPGTVTLENLPSIAQQMVRILDTLTAISDILFQVFNIDESTNGMASLYGYLYGDKTELVQQLFYVICRVNTELVPSLLDRLSIDTPESALETFYVIEVLAKIIAEDKTGEIGILLGSQINEKLKNCFTNDAGSELMEQAAQIISKTEIFTSQKLIADAMSHLLAADQEIRTTPKVEPGDLQLSAVGSLDIFNLDLNNLLNSVRILNVYYSLHKWELINAVKEEKLDSISTMICKVSSSLTIMVIDTLNEEAFDVSKRTVRTQQLLDLVLPWIDTLNLLLNHLLGTTIKNYSNLKLLQEIINIHAIAVIMDKNPQAKRIWRATLNTIILWGQFKFFLDMYLQVFIDNMFGFPYKQISTYNLLSALLEHYISYKDPSFFAKIPLYFMKRNPSFFNPNMILYLLSGERSSKRLAAAEIYASEANIKKVMDNRKKHVLRYAWENGRNFNLASVLSQERYLLTTILDFYLYSNNLEAHKAIVRFLRCILSSQDQHCCEIIVERLMTALNEASIRVNVIRTIHGIVDIPSANVTFINQDLPETLMDFLGTEELRIPTLQILASLFDDSLGLCSSEKKTASYKLVEDVPNISQTTIFIRTCRQFLIFQVQSQSLDMMTHEDSLYSEFVEFEEENVEENPKVTELVLQCLLNISKNAVGRSLIISGEFPMKDGKCEVSFEELLTYIQAGLSAGNVQNLVLLELVLAIVSNVGFTVCTQDQLSELKPTIGTIEHFKAKELAKDLESLLSHPPQPNTDIELPRDTRSLKDRFDNQLADHKRMREVQAKQNMEFQRQLVVGDRVGERPIVKPFHSLTDMIPPPYPSVMFKFRSSGMKEWDVDYSQFDPQYTLKSKSENEKIALSDEQTASYRPISNYEDDYSQMAQMHQMYMMQNQFQPMQPQQPISQPVNAMSLLSEAETAAKSELTNLLVQNSESKDPRIEARIRQILEEHPQLAQVIGAINK